MTTRPAGDVHDGLVAKGMVPHESHHKMLRMEVNGVTTLVTRISHGSKEINDGLGKLMANQCCLQLREFWNLVDCPLSQEEWVALVRQRCAGGRNPFLSR
jgi:hypothetical protein